MLPNSVPGHLASTHSGSPQGGPTHRCLIDLPEADSPALARQRCEPHVLWARPGVGSSKGISTRCRSWGPCTADTHVHQPQIRTELGAQGSDLDAVPCSGYKFGRGADFQCSDAFQRIASRPPPRTWNIVQPRAMNFVFWRPWRAERTSGRQRKPSRSCR